MDEFVIQDIAGTSLSAKKHKRNLEYSTFPSCGSNNEDNLLENRKQINTDGLDTIERSNDISLASKAIKHFKDIASSGPSYICSCCTQTWFKDGVRKADSLVSFATASKCLLGVKSAEDVEWVCHTCHKYIKMGKTPAFSVINGFRFPRKPPELDITEMEERLISPRIPFMQLMEKPRGGQKSLRGNVVNVPADVNETVKSLPRTLADTETIQVKLKIKQNFKHHVFL